MRMTFRQALSLFLANPLLFFEFISVKFKIIKIPQRGPAQKKINGVIFEFDFYYDPAIKYMYINDYQSETVRVMKKILSKGDTFIDVGANIGYLSAIAAGIVGSSGHVHSFEPVPEYFSKLERLAVLNRDYNIVANKIALGSECGMSDIKITSLNNIGWNTLVPGFMSNQRKIKEILQVPVYRLDRYIKENKLNKIKLLKIDVEGFEFPVLKGLSDYFDNTAYFPFIICEINPFACQLMGCTLKELSEYMKKYSYKAYGLVDPDKEINIMDLKVTTDVLFVNTK